MDASAANMFPSYTRYPAYKHSGVEWLGQIPAHWDVKRLKHLGTLKGGAGFPDSEQGDPTQSIPFFKVGDMGSAGNEREMLYWQHAVSLPTARALRAFVFTCDTIVFAKVGAALMLNRRRILTRPSCIDNNMMGFTPTICDPLWAIYWLSGLDLRKLANPGAVPSVNESQLKDTETIVPPLPEQRAIAAYLDRETARIDALAAKQQRLIELLREKRAALISAAVTRGLDPNVPLKDSGVEWLGQIPAHWDVKRLKHLGTLKGGAGFPDSEQGDPTQSIPFFKVGDMGSAGNEREMLYWQHAVSLPTARALRAFVFTCDTIVFAKVGAALMLNRRRILTRPSCIDNNMMGFTPTICDPLWAIYWLSGLDLRKLANPGAVPSVNESQLKDTETIVPPLPEQRAIAAYLDRETARIDALAAKQQRLIELLREKRAALISAAVTGKIDVRERAA